MLLECVSSVWGGEAKPFTILLSDYKDKAQIQKEVQGHLQYRALSITPSLYMLLCRLRQRWSPSLEERAEDMQRVVWDDAVCINQADPLEKRAMPVIYAAARRVIVDIGEESQDLGEA
jgi:hypothetical protein